MADVTKQHTFNDGDNFDPQKVNEDFDDIYNKMNGLIQSDNISNDAIITAKIIDDAVTNAKILDATIAIGKLADRRSTVATGWTKVDFGFFEVYFKAISFTPAAAVQQLIPLDLSAIASTDFDNAAVIVLLTPFFSFQSEKDFDDIAYGIEYASGENRIRIDTNDTLYVSQVLANDPAGINQFKALIIDNR